jgi:hypothetical protein
LQEGGERWEKAGEGENLRKVEKDCDKVRAGAVRRVIMARTVRRIPSETANNDEDTKAVISLAGVRKDREGTRSTGKVSA